MSVGRTTIEYFAAYNPRMHGISNTRVPTFSFVCPPGARTFAACSQQIDTFADGENASQADLTARVARRVSKHGEILYGLRYLNFGALRRLPRPAR